MKQLSDPLMRVGVMGSDAPLFAPREIQVPIHRGHVPMAATSIAAHAGRDRGSDRALILRMIQERPRTLDELAAELAVSPNAISGRCTELARAGLIRRTNQRRKTRAGASAFVWQA